MATRRYKLSVGKDEFAIVEEVGAATNSDTVELTVDLASTTVNTTGGTRTITKQEVLDILMKFENYILKSNWPPA